MIADHAFSPGLRYARDQGFTLVEMLVSLAILGMMAAMLLSGLQTVGMFAGRTVAQIDADDSVVAAQRLLRDRIEQLRPTINPNSSVAIVDANGDEANFNFIAPPLARAEPDSLWRYRIVVTAAGDLILLTANSLDDRFNFTARDDAGWQPLTLLNNVRVVRINYFGERLTGFGSSWQINWAQRPQPPALVRIRVAFRDGDRRRWPDLVIRPRATDNTACKIDLLTGRCGAPS